MSKKTVLLLVTDGTEEMEAVITADVLRRAGVQVTIASITDNECVKCSRDVKLCADVKLDAIKNEKYDAIVLPGGAGSKTFASSEEVGKLLKAQEQENGIIAAICAAPIALKAHGIGKQKKITCYPSVKDDLISDYEYVEDKVVIDGNLITSRGPATAFAFGLAIAKKLLNDEVANTVAKAMLYEDNLSVGKGMSKDPNSSTISTKDEVKDRLICGYRKPENESINAPSAFCTTELLIVFSPFRLDTSASDKLEINGYFELYHESHKIKIWSPSKFLQSELDNNVQEKMYVHTCYFIPE